MCALGFLQIFYFVFFCIDLIEDNKTYFAITCITVIAEWNKSPV